MSCNAEERKTYENIKRLATLAKRLTGRVQTIYREVGKTYYGFCDKEAYTTSRGTAVTDV